jgi:putative transposase
MIYPLVTDLAADGVPGYYRGKTSPATGRDWVDARLVYAAREIHDEDSACGYRFIASELTEKGIVTGEIRVQRFWRTTASGLCSPRSGATGP